jgi:hypothetical protein
MIINGGAGASTRDFSPLKTVAVCPFEYLSASLNFRLHNEIKRLSIRVPGQSEVSVRT